MGSKLAKLAMLVGCAVVLKGSIGFAICHNKAEDNYSKSIERIEAIENALEHKAAVERPWVQAQYATLDDELSELQQIPGIMQQKDAYETARNREAWCVLAMGIGYTLCIAGRLKENHKP